MEINKVDMFKLSDFAEDERVFVSIVCDSGRIMVEPISSIKSPEVLGEGALGELSVGDMMRSFEGDEVPENYGVIIRVR